MSPEPLKDINQMTRLPACTIQCMLECHCHTSVIRPQHEVQSLQAMLTDCEVQFIQGCLEHSPDMYLNELQMQLGEATIWRALQRIEYT
ncbi:hypothetical protein PAXRUDRAFT_824483 [Paxillus rubicundulus Ve08.2h10]|uniref:Uncharacterized protein n=1 Tax=Paxillus rubicundulus Ve08.2h10 TaxID=930991 RepID=A0A0D0E7S2_9AGAM|nr:hypothetical protein PAXRUDRAFT_824483 [Paxillus rubicundulus Ve08.2h10]